MEEINPEKNEYSSSNYLNLLNILFSSSNSNQLKSLEDLSNDFFVYNLIIQIEPNFENIFLNNLILNVDDIEIKINNFNIILTSIKNYIKEKIKDKEIFFEKISTKKLIDKESDELITLAEMLIILTIICKNKNYYLEKINQIEDNNINKLYYSIIKNYINFYPMDNIKPIQINKSDFIFDEENNEIIELKQEKNYNKEFKGELIIEKQENIFNGIISPKNNINYNNNNNNKNSEEIMDSLRNENEDLHRTIDNLCIEKQELQALVEKLNINQKELELDYQKLKEEYDIKEQNYSGIISNNKNVIEKLNKDLKSVQKLSQNLNEEKKLLLNELNKYKENTNELIAIKKKLEEKDILINKLLEKNKEYEKQKEKIEENNYYKKSYEEQKMRVNEEHKLISESLYKLAIHFITLKDDLQNRINQAKNTNK